VSSINKGEVHFYEPDLDILIKSAIQSGRLTASIKPVEADVFIIAVPTPLNDDYSPNVTHVFDAMMMILPVLRAGNLVILESTSPVGTTEEVVDLISKNKPDLSLSDEKKDAKSRIYVAHCPERVLPGQILKELVDNDRIVGGVDDASTKRAKAFYETFINGEIICTNSRTAELCKLVENSFRDVNIAFANELSIICEQLRINVWDLIEMANRHPRVNILQPGPGVGGHCIAVDPWFIIQSAPNHSSLVRAARGVNDKMPLAVVSRIKRKAACFKDPVIACLGLSFKANIDDLRESPAVDIVKMLVEDQVGKILIVEPHIDTIPRELACSKNLIKVELDEALMTSDVVVLLVNHRGFIDIDRESLKGKVVIDTRGVWR
jgi:UDP-N-acetyl-D-mannosaminuronic acid dehydrogenase